MGLTVRGNDLQLLVYLLLIMIEFNRIYVIESLPEGEEKTGTQLNDDLLRWQQYRYKGFKSVLLEPKDILEWTESMEIILDDTVNKGVFPIIHFEIHGSTNKDGLVLASGELVSWESMRTILTKINIASRMNLFVSLAVCHGAYLLMQYQLDQRAFCSGLLGSFDEIKVSDLKIRFTEFYQELFTTFDMNKAYQRLLNSNPCVEIDYKCISALEIFCRIYKNYIITQVNDPERVKQRALDAAKANGLRLETRQQKRSFQRDFAKQIHKTKNQYYMEHSTKFLMMDLFPEKKNDYNIPADLDTFMTMNIIPQS